MFTTVRNENRQNITLKLYFPDDHYTRRIYCDGKEKNHNGLMHQNASVCFRTKTIEENINLRTLEPQLVASSNAEPTGDEIIVEDRLRKMRGENN